MGLFVDDEPELCVGEGVAEYELGVEELELLGRGCYFFHFDFCFFGPEVEEVGEVVLKDVLIELLFFGVEDVEEVAVDDEGLGALQQFLHGL